MQYADMFIRFYLISLCIGKTWEKAGKNGDNNLNRQTWTADEKVKFLSGKIQRKKVAVD